MLLFKRINFALVTLRQGDFINTLEQTLAPEWVDRE